MRISFKQRLCPHNLEIVARNTIVSENLYMCTRCGVFLVFHTGLWLSFYTRELPKGPGWKFNLF